MNDYQILALMASIVYASNKYSGNLQDALADANWLLKKARIKYPIKVAQPTQEPE